MRQTEAWWTCDKCGCHLIKPGKKGIKEAMLDHRKTCHELACFSIVQVEQRKQ